jgi:hypothetical protein
LRNNLLSPPLLLPARATQSTEDPLRTGSRIKEKEVTSNISNDVSHLAAEADTGAKHEPHAPANTTSPATAPAVQYSVGFCTGNSIDKGLPIELAFENESGPRAMVAIGAGGRS